MRRALLLLLVAWLLVLPAVAHAYEDQLTLGLGAGYAHAASDVLPRHGALLEVTASAGLGAFASARVRASYAHHPHDSPLHAFGLGADLLYVIDVIELVPYFGAGAGGFGLLRDGELDPELELHLVLGADYLLSRAIALELELRPHVIATAAEDPFYFAVAAAVVWFFDG